VSSRNTLSVLKEILQDLDNASSSDNNEVSGDIITHIKATDRAATELKFNDLLQPYRDEVLPMTYINYETFREETMQKQHINVDLKWKMISLMGTVRFL